MTSLWTGTPHFRMCRGPLLIQTLGVCLAARAFPSVDFVTDSRGAEIADRLGWRFNRVMTVFDNDLNTDGLEHVWALKKISACLTQTEPFVQFDGDVLMFRPLPERLTSARLVAQSLDYWQHYTSPEMKEGFQVAELPSDVDKFNAGLIGGADVALVRAWALYALELARAFRHQLISGTVASMIVEQASFGIFSARVGVAVQTLLRFPFQKDNIAEAGFIHLAGAAKHEPRWIDRAERRLRAEFPDAYARFLEGSKFFDFVSTAPCSSYE